MASKLQQALGLSLDDYIAEKGIQTGERPKTAAIPETNGGAAFFKRQLRSDQDEEDDEDLFDMDECLPMDECDEEELLGDTPPPLIPANAKVGDEAKKSTSGNENAEPEQENDGGDGEVVERTFVTIEQQRGIRHMPSQQGRLRRECLFKRPAGLQPLMSVKAEFDRNTDNLIAALGENAKFQSDESRFRIQDRLGKLGRQNYNNGGRNNGDRYRNQNRHRNQFNGKPCLPSFNPSRDRFQQHHQQQQQANRGGPMNDLRPLLSGPHPLLSGPHPLAVDPFGGQIAAFTSALAQFGQPSSAQDSDKFTLAVQNALRHHQHQEQGGQLQRQGLLGPAPNCPPMAMAPFAAANVLLNQMATVQQNFSSKYDMKIQKEIHELQGKKMLYGTSGVVSTDGPGIEDERIRPVSTDLSMNMRFSSLVVEN